MSCSSTTTTALQQFVEPSAKDCKAAKPGISMKSLQVRLRSKLQSDRFLTKGNSVVPMGAPARVNLTHNCRIKWPESHNMQQHQQQQFFQTAAKKLQSRSPSFSPPAALSQPVSTSFSCKYYFISSSSSHTRNFDTVYLILIIGSIIHMCALARGGCR